MRLATTTIILCFALHHPDMVAADRPELGTESDRISYSLGHQVGSDLKQLGVQPETSALLRGMQDGLKGSEPMLEQKEMQTLLGRLKSDVIKAKQQEQFEALQARRIEREMARRQGEEFTAANARKPGVKTLPSGLQYRIITAGNGDRPAAFDRVTVHYRSTLINGDEFGSSGKDAPETFSVNDVIPGLKEALLLMPQGSRWEVVIPPELGFGRRGALEDQTLIYEVELLDIQKSGKDQAVEQKAEAK